MSDVTVTGLDSRIRVTGDETTCSRIYDRSDSRTLSFKSVSHFELSKS
jgi:hypothetical protein